MSDATSALADGRAIESAIQEAEAVMGLKTSAKTKQNYASGARQVAKFLRLHGLNDLVNGDEFVVPLPANQLLFVHLFNFTC